MYRSKAVALYGVDILLLSDVPGRTKNGSSFAGAAGDQATEEAFLVRIAEDVEFAKLSISRSCKQ